MLTIPCGVKRQSAALGQAVWHRLAAAQSKRRLACLPAPACGGSDVSYRRLLALGMLAGGLFKSSHQSLHLCLCHGYIAACQAGHHS
jgi:hypothetical protein